MRFLIKESFAHDLKARSPLSVRIGIAAATKSEPGDEWGAFRRSQRGEGSFIDVRRGSDGNHAD